MDVVDQQRIKGYFDAIAPSMASDARFTVFLEMAEPRCDRNYFGDLWRQAMAYLVAHTMEMSNRSGSESGSILSRHEGDISVTYGTAEAEAGELGITTYGRAYRSLLQQCSAGFIVTGGNQHSFMSWGHC